MLPDALSLAPLALPSFTLLVSPEGMDQAIKGKASAAMRAPTCLDEDEFQRFLPDAVHGSAVVIPEVVFRVRGHLREEGPHGLLASRGMATDSHLYL